SSSAASMGQDSMSSTTTTPSPTSSSSSPSPGTPCSSSSTSISPPSLPQPTVSAAALSTSQAVSAQGRMVNSHQKEKRHSLSALSFSQNSPQSTGSYRHSMEVLIGSTTDSTFGSESQNKAPGPQTPVSNMLIPPTVPTQ
ncbi:putative protein TPRXL, partial [Limulus polyphemus]|uniref:Uncharacterized protein n=1 Tax=Limulus polyphemus TaxID=6850 RepID=A0ABM1C3K8_LIMPO